MDKETARKLLEVLSDEDVAFLISEKAESEAFVPIKANSAGLKVSLTDSERFYLSKKISGSTQRCYKCGQSLVNNPDHAASLLLEDNPPEVKN